MREPIAIIGIGALYPEAESLHAYWRLLRRSDDAIREVPPTHWSASDYLDPDSGRDGPDKVYCARGGFLEPVDFDPTEFGIPPTVLEATDTAQLLSLLVARNALADAGYGSEREFAREHASVILGVTGTLELVVPLGSRLGYPRWMEAMTEAGIPAEVARSVADRINGDYVEWQENSFPGLLGNVVAGRIANRLNLRGTNCVVDAACASSLSALHLAILELETGRSDMVLTGGVDAFNDIFMFMCFAKTQALSRSGDARPFSAKADGTVLGEGVGMLVLKRLSDAERDGDRVYATIRGMGTSSDGKSQSIYAPRASGQAAALRTAYENAGVSPASVGMVEAHGTGTRVGDSVEFEALQTVWSEASEGTEAWCALGSVKSQIGHTKAAAGAASLIKAALALHHKVIPGTIKVDEPNPAMKLDDSPFFIPTETNPWLANGPGPRRAGVSSFGFGGSNFHAVLEEYGSAKREVAWDGSVELVALSADSREELTAALESFADTVREGGLPELQHAAAQSRREFQSSQNHRVTVVFRRGDSVSALIDEALARVRGGSLPSGKRENRQIQYAEGPAPGKLAFLFPGQGSQYPWMARDVVCTFPEAFEVAQAAAGIEFEGKPLTAAVYPRTTLGGRAGQWISASTALTQPALALAELAWCSALKYFGVKAHATAGHSFGELVALQAAGAFTALDTLGLSAARGKAMAAAALTLGGTMLAVAAPSAAVEPILPDSPGSLGIANINSPRQTVLSGDEESVAWAAAEASRRGWVCQKLDVAGAFHSPAMGPAREPFGRALAATPFLPTSLPVFSNGSAQEFPQDANAIRASLEAQLVNPVRFSQTIDALVAAGVGTFLEVGPKSVLTRLVSAILEDRPHHAFSVDDSQGKDCGIADLAVTLGRLAALGYDVDLSRWERPVGTPVKRKMTVKLAGANYRSPQSAKPAAPSIVTIPIPEPALAAVSAKEALVNQTRPQNLPAVEQQSVIAPNQSAAASPPAALTAIEEGLRALQEIQRQTTQAHMRFLDTQEAAQGAIRAVLGLDAGSAAGSVAPVLSSARFEAQPLSGPGSPSNGHHSPPAAVPKVEVPIVARETVATPLPAPSHDDTNIAPTAPPPRFPTEIIEVVSELTGYPTDTITMDMDLEADLGIDSIKRVEILAAIQRKNPALSPVDPGILGSMRTLNEVMAALSAGAAPSPSASSMVSPTAPRDLNSPVTAENGSSLLPVLCEVVSELTGYPVDSIESDMDLEADLGIDSIKRVEILAAAQKRIPGAGHTSTAELGALRTLRQVADLLAGGAPAGTSGAPACTTPQCVGANAKAAANGNLAGQLANILAELTGYPAESIDPDHDLEADLGIDSIKRVELLSAVRRQMPELPEISSDVAPTLRTLSQIAAHLGNGAEAREAIFRASATAPVSAPSESDGDVPARYELAYVPVAGAAGNGHKSNGTKTICDALVVNGAAGAAFTAKLEARIPGTRAMSVNEAIAHGAAGAKCIVVVADGYRGEGGLASGESIAEAEAHFELVKSLAKADTRLELMVALIPQLEGSDPAKAVYRDPVAGALSGLVKTFRAEHPETAVAIVECDAASLDAATEIVANLHPHAGQLDEIRILAGVAYRAELKPAAADGNPSDIFSAKDVAVFTGGARGVTADCAFEFARRTGARAVLLGRTPEPAEEPEHLRHASTEKDLLAAISGHSNGNGRKTPAEALKVAREVLASREIAATLARFRAAGLDAAYLQADIQDRESVQAAMSAAASMFGPVTILVHGAGVIADRRLENKTMDQFRAVFGTKVVGLRNLMEAASPASLRAVALFSSVSARFGNVGQADYAAANEVLNKAAGALALQLPKCRVVSIGWGPWDGGMVDERLKQMFERAGVGLIPVAAGARAFAVELAAPPAGPVEIVIGDGLPDSSPVAARKPAAVNAAADNGAGKVIMERVVDVATHPFLGDHVLASRPVVPAALILEWFAHAALHEYPGYECTGLGRFRVFKALALDDASVAIRIEVAGVAGAKNSPRLALVLKSRDASGHEVRHAGVEAQLAPMGQAGANPHAISVAALEPYQRTVDEIYSGILFHGPAFQAIAEVRGISRDAMELVSVTAPAPAKWLTSPHRSRWILDPVVLDACFQIGVVWNFEHSGRVALPSGVEQVRIYRQVQAGALPVISLSVAETSAHNLRANVAVLDANRLPIIELSGVEWTADDSLAEAYGRQLPQPANC